MSNTPAPNPPPVRKPGMILVVLGAALLLAIAANFILPPRWRPQLQVRNTGTNAVTVAYKGGTFVTRPGEAWQMRFSAGDTLTLRAGTAADAPAHLVPLPERNPKPWSFNPIAQRWTVEVNADDPKNIRFENRRYEEITQPPSPSQPWP